MVSGLAGSLTLIGSHIACLTIGFTLLVIAFFLGLNSAVALLSKVQGKHGRDSILSGIVCTVSHILFPFMAVDMFPQALFVSLILYTSATLLMLCFSHSLSPHYSYLLKKQPATTIEMRCLQSTEDV